ncbi:MAG: hypothetical protein IJ157_11525 [Clostridia bacterium]|nr:hypothetical protein [Clostridia bacterium]
MKIEKELYDLAYAFKRSKIWNKILENEIFAVDMGDGIGYCSIMGKSGQHTALGIYMDAEGFSSLRVLNCMDISSLELLLSQDCIQLSLEKKEELSPEELSAVKAYCDRTGTPFRTPYPQFSRYHPNCTPWHISKDADWRHMKRALQVVNALAEALQHTTKADLGLYPLILGMGGEAYEALQLLLFSEETEADNVTVPLFCLENGRLSSRRIPLPPYVDPALLPPTRVNELALARLKKLPQKGVYQCEVIRSPEPVDGEPPYLPALFMTADEESGMLLHPVTPEGAVYDPDEMLDAFIHVLVSQKAYPALIKARSDETLLLLRDFCAKANIRLEETDELPELDEALDELFDQYENDSGDHEQEVLDMLRQMSAKEIAGMPEQLLEHLRMLASEGILPADISEKLPKKKKH